MLEEDVVDVQPESEPISGFHKLSEGDEEDLLHVEKRME